MGSTTGIRGEEGRDGALDPATALTVVEAANLAGVGVGEIEGWMADGTLLYETERHRGHEVPMIRLMDLADVYPSLRRTRAHSSAGGSAGDPAGAPAGSKASRREASTSHDGQTTEGSSAAFEADPAPVDAPPATQLPQLFAVRDTPPVDAAGSGHLADAVRASGADRNALIELCQDLETRLDLAERERQASTASLLMAQRRVLDLEHRRDRRPMAVAAAATLGVFGLALAILAFRLPKTVSAAARAEMSLVESRLAEQSAALEASVESSLVSARAEERQRGAAAAERYEAQIAALELRLGEARKLHMAEIAKVAELAKAQVQQDRDVAAAEREADAQKRRIELAAWEERIEGAELATVAAREALKLERVLNGADRALFRSELDEALGRHNAALQTAIDRIQTTEAPASVLPFGPLGKAPAPWWKRALDDLRD